MFNPIQVEGGICDRWSNWKQPAVRLLLTGTKHLYLDLIAQREHDEQGTSVDRRFTAYGQAGSSFKPDGDAVTKVPPAHADMRIVALRWCFQKAFQITELWFPFRVLTL